MNEILMRLEGLGGGEGVSRVSILVNILNISRDPGHHSALTLVVSHWPGLITRH